MLFTRIPAEETYVNSAASRSDRIKLYIAFATLYVVWGTTYLAIKAGLDAGLPPALFGGLRLLPAGLIMFGLAKWRGASLRVSRRQFTTVAIVGMCLLVGGQYGCILAERTIPSGFTALIVAVVPLWIALAESAFPDMERPSLWGWLGLAVGFAGLAILLLPDLLGIKSGGWATVTGIGIVLLGSWLWSGGSIYSKRHPTGLDGIVSTAWQMLIAGGFLLLLGTVLGEWPKVVLTPKAIGAIAYLTVFGSCIAFTAFTYALAHAPASKVVTYAYVNPVIAVFVGWLAGLAGLVPPEPVTLAMLLGMMVIVAGVALTTSAPTLPPRNAVKAAPDQLLEPVPNES